MPWRKPPRVNFEEQAEYRWSFWKLGLQEDDLFGDLHERFNTVPMFIQDPDAFHHDVNEIARQALNKEDFYARLQKRRDQRLEELLDMENKIGALHVSGYNRLTDNQRFHRIRLECFASLDCLVAFCASFLTPNEKGVKPSLDIFLRSEERRARSTLFKGLAASLDPSTPDSLDLEHADLPPSPPEGDGGCPPSATLGRDSASLSPEPCALETPIRRKRKYSKDFDSDGSPQLKRPRPESLSSLEHDEVDTSAASEETNREKNVPESFPQRDEHDVANTVGPNTVLPPTPDHQPHLSPAHPKPTTEQTSRRFSPQSPTRSDTKTRKSSRQNQSPTRPSTKQHAPKPSIRENSISPQRRSGRISARSGARELKT
ncbi:hypothetical protein NCS52_01248100 [Fusarium sp. LHS14.1]|nr:hypothetical protein NCS52_01248100 [Fusarium sp. LHS14.1]